MNLVHRYRRGGISGAWRAVRRTAAAVIAPDSAPPAETARPASLSDSLPARNNAERDAVATFRPSALGVSHADASAWFEKRRAGYVELAAAIRPHLPTDGVLYDVGANIGYFTKVLADELGFDGSVHLFEPIPHLAALCSQTLHGEDVAWSLHGFGLSDENASVDIFVAADGNLGWNTLVAGRRTHGMKAVPIKVRRFDDLGFLVAPDVIKIDVEGAEHRVLHGMRDSLIRWSPRPTILCEIGWGAGHPDWQAELAAFEMLAGLGYRPYALDMSPIDVADLTATSDVLFIPTHHD